MLIRSLSIFFLLTTLSCKPLPQSGESTTQNLKDDGIEQSQKNLPTRFIDWIDYEQITEEQQKTIDTIFENVSFLGDMTDRKKAAKKVAEIEILDLGGSKITNLDPVLSLKRLSTLYLMPNPELTQEEIYKLDKLSLSQVIISKKFKCPKQFINRYNEICIKTVIE